jgi:hypothetical protein
MKSTELSGIFYEEIVMYYKTLSKMFKDLNDMITDQLVRKTEKAIKTEQ